MRYRIEKDAVGKVRVPADAYYGSDTARTIQNFQISGIKVPDELVVAYIMLKEAAAAANMKVGKLDKRRGKAILYACRELLKHRLPDQFPIDIFQAGAGTSTNMNVNEVIANIAIEHLGGRKGDYSVVHPNDHVNMSQSTNDTYPSALDIAARLAVERKLVPELRRLQIFLYAKSREFSKIVKIGRTHLQDAVPMTLGEEFYGYAGEVDRATQMLERASEGLLELPLGGTAVGTGLNAGPEYTKHVIIELNKITGENFVSSKNKFAATQNRIEILALGDAMKEVAVVLMKIANDLRLLASGPRGGAHEIILPPIMPGSSIMPGKVNPSIPEAVGMVCLQVMGIERTITSAASEAQLELNVFTPVIAYDTLFSIKILSNAAKIFSDKCIKGIKASRSEISKMVSEDLSIATALNQYIGYSKAAEIAKKAYAEGKTVMQVCLDMGVLDKKKLKKILDPKKMV
ncbi:MAG: aspartate ammonia-lyase [Candidatus Micrarchaeaceae archaeon]